MTIKMRICETTAHHSERVTTSLKVGTILVVGTPREQGRWLREEGQSKAGIYLVYHYWQQIRWEYVGEKALPTPKVLSLSSSTPLRIKDLRHKSRLLAVLIFVTHSTVKPTTIMSARRNAPVLLSSATLQCYSTFSESFQHAGPLEE